jgi:hypothetical protein
MDEWVMHAALPTRKQQSRGAMLTLYSVASWRGNDRETAYSTAVLSSAYHTRWLGKVDIEIGRQMDNISPVLDHGPRTAWGNLISCHQTTSPA